MIKLQVLCNVCFCLIAIASAFVSVQKLSFRNDVKSYSRSSSKILYASSNKITDKEGRRLTPAQKAIQESVRKNSNNFDKLKNVAYGTADEIQNFAGKRDIPVSRSFVVGGYSDLQNRATPTQKLMKALNDPRDTGSSPSMSVFETVKGAVYGTVDVASSIGKFASSASFRVSEALENEKVPTKFDSRDLVDSLPDLQSSNPIKRLAAEAKLKNMEIEEKVRKTQKGAQDNIDSVKNNVYAAGDFVTDTVENVKALPGVLTDTVENAKAIPGKVTKSVQDVSDFFNSIPTTLQTKVNEIKAIPSEVEAKVMEVKQSVEDVKNSFDNTVERTKQIIDDVKNIPNKVQETVENTKNTIDSTVKTFEEVSTSIKVLLGLEKPKPKPPKLPPPKQASTPQSIAGDIAFKVAGTVASTVGKVVFWAGKSTAQLTAAAATKGFEAVKESIAKQQQTPEIKPSQAVAPPRPIVDSKPTTPKVDSKPTTPKVSTVKADKIPKQTKATAEKQTKATVESPTVEKQTKATIESPTVEKQTKATVEIPTAESPTVEKQTKATVESPTVKKQTKATARNPTVEKPPKPQNIPATSPDIMETDEIEIQIAEALKLAEDALSPKESSSRSTDNNKDKAPEKIE